MSLPPRTVQASRAHRIQRQQARYRDRGGIFKPAEHNPLLDLLLARGVNGESPSRTTSPHPSPSPSTSPRRKHPASHPAHRHPSDLYNTISPSTNPRTNANRKPTHPNTTLDAQNALPHTSAPGPSTALDSPPSSNRPAPKTTKKSSRSKSSARAVPPPDSSGDDLPLALLARSRNSRTREDTSESTKQKRSRPKQLRKRKVPPQSSAPVPHIEVLTDHEAPATSRKKVEKKTTSSKSKVAVVAKLMTNTEGDEDSKPAPAKSRLKLSAQPAQYFESDSEQAPKKSVKGKLKAKSPEEEDFASQVPGGRATAKKATKSTKTDTKARGQFDTGKDSTNVSETSARPSTSRETKKRKKPAATSTCNDLPSAGCRAHLDSNSEKQPPQSRSPSPAPINEPAKKRRKARQAADDEKSVEEQAPLIQNHRPSRQRGNAEDANETRKVSRSKAPPIPMPNGVRLKPKPRPRLSMFQPPLDEHEDSSDRDPIDFLS